MSTRVPARLRAGDKLVFLDDADGNPTIPNAGKAVDPADPIGNSIVHLEVTIRDLEDDEDMRLVEATGVIVSPTKIATTAHRMVEFGRPHSVTVTFSDGSKLIFECPREDYQKWKEVSKEVYDGTGRWHDECHPTLDGVQALYEDYTLKSVDLDEIPNKNPYQIVFRSDTGPVGQTAGDFFVITSPPLNQPALPLRPVKGKHSVEGYGYAFVDRLDNTHVVKSYQASFPDVPKEDFEIRAAGIRKALGEYFPQGLIRVVGDVQLGEGQHLSFTNVSCEAPMSGGPLVAGGAVVAFFSGGFFWENRNFVMPVVHLFVQKMLRAHEL